MKKQSIFQDRYLQKYNSLRVGDKVILLTYFYGIDKSQIGTIAYKDDLCYSLSTQKIIEESYVFTVLFENNNWNSIQFNQLKWIEKYNSDKGLICKRTE